MPDSGMLGRIFEMQKLCIKVILNKFNKSIKLLVAKRIVRADLGVSGVRLVYSILSPTSISSLIYTRIIKNATLKIKK